MNADYERATIVTEMLYNARVALGAAVTAAEAFPDAPGGVVGLYALCKQVEGAWNNFMRTVPDEEGDSINSLVEAVDAENEVRG